MINYTLKYRFNFKKQHLILLMKKTSIKAFNKIYLISSIITFIISFYPRLEDFWKITLLIIALGLLITTYFLSYTGSIDKIEEEINSLKKEIEDNKKVLNTLRDLYILNKV